MVDTAAAPDVDGRSPARPRGRPAGLGPHHQPRRRSRRGVVADHPRRRALPRLLVGDRRHQHRSRPPAGRGGGRGAGREAAPRPAEHPLPRARACGCTTGSAGAPAGRPVAGVPVELGRRGGRGRGQARAGRDRPAGDHRVPLRLPRPDRPDDGADDRQGRLPGRLRAAARDPSTTRAYPYCYRAAGGAHAPDACTLRLGGAARPDLPPVHLPGPGRRRSSSSRSSARAATSSRRRASCRGSARSPASTGSCSSPTRSRPGFGRTGEMFAVQHWDVEPDILVMAKGIASGLPLSGILARRGADGAWKPGHPRRHVRRQRRVVRGGQRDARRHRGRGPRRPTPGSAARSSSAGLRALAAALPVDRRRARARAAWSRSSSSSPASATAGRRTRT